MRRNSAKNVAMGGVFAALAVVIMCLGTVIPVATFICPMLCMMLLMVVWRMTGSRIAWAWYGAVSLLSMLLAPDKEAAAVFVFLGYYPIVKPWLDRRKLAWLWKFAVFNVSIFLMYGTLIYLFGLNAILEDFAELGMVMSVVTWVLGMVTLFMLDYILTHLLLRRKRK